MAYGEQSTTQGSVAYTIHVWPSSDLVASSWSWPECQHVAYAQVAGALALTAATQLLQGRVFCREEVEASTEIGCVRFTISQAGATVHIVIAEFTGPFVPPPDDGLGMQPAAIGGLVVGLRGSGRRYHMVVFCGSMPHIPAVHSNLESDAMFLMISNVQELFVSDYNFRQEFRLHGNPWSSFAGLFQPGGVDRASNPMSNGKFHGNSTERFLPAEPPALALKTRASTVSTAIENRIDADKLSSRASAAENWRSSSRSLSMGALGIKQSQLDRTHDCYLH